MPDAIAQPEFTTVIGVTSDLCGRTMPTGRYQWFCPSCRRMNLLGHDQLGSVTAKCEHCSTKADIHYSDQPIVVVDPAKAEKMKKTPTKLGRTRRIRTDLPG